MRWQAWWLLVGLGTFGCGEKVDCDTFCSKQTQCVEQIQVLLGTASPDQFARLSESDKKVWANRQRERCVPDCNSPTKPFSLHTKWRRCLTLPDCTEFAKCVVR